MLKKRKPRPAPLNQWTPEQIQACFAGDRRAYVLFKWQHEWCFYTAWPSSIDKGYFYKNIYVGVYMVETAMRGDEDPFKEISSRKLEVSEFTLDKTCIKCSLYIGCRTIKFNIPYSQLSIILEKIPKK